MCLEGTRQDILQNIRIWVADLEAPNILWVNGYPGVGKSAIASTIVEELHSSNRCGSSFFFQRERASAMTPSAFWCKVAYDLARRYPGIRKHIVTALIANESFPTTLNIDALFRELISEPLTKSDEIPIDKLPVIVLDALDECGGIDGWRSDHRKKLIRTLKSWSSLSRRFKLVVTSRWEEDIERLFSTISHHPVEVFSGEKANSASAVDIRTFLLHELGQLLDRYPSLPSDWPGEEEIVRLINGANGMFIWIKTVIKLLESGEPRRTLRQVLSNGAGSMADLYAWILHASFPKPSGDDVKDFKSALGAVIFAKEPLDVANLAHFLSIDGSTMEYICNGLKSVLDCGKIIRVRHQSFVDFLLDSKECPPAFLLSKSREATSLALCCLNTMKQHLKFNICDLESSYVRNQDVPNLAQRVDECIPPYLSYSSRYWTTHLADTPFNNDIRNGVKYFMDYQFLWWLETMSLLKRISIGPNMLHSLINWLQKANQDDSLATDMQKFAAAFASVISQSTPHIYISAIAFAPRSLGVSKQYLSQYPQTLTVRSGGCNSWSSIQSIDIDHKDLFLSVSISSDGKRIVSGSSDRTVRIWDAETGQTILGPLHGHSHSVYSASFSPDGKRVVSCSSDHTIRVWDAETGGTVLDPLHGHRDAVNSVSFSPDGKRIVSGSSDHMIRVWDAETGEMVLGPLRGHRDSVNSVSLSPDGKRIASGSMDAKIRVWDAETGEVVLGPLQGHSHSVCAPHIYLSALPFAPRSLGVSKQYLEHYRQTLRVKNGGYNSWPAIQSACAGHKGSVYSAAFSSDGRRIVSGGHDNTVRVWDAETGKVVIGPLKGHRGAVYSVAFSPDGRRIVSGSWDHTIRVWDASTGRKIADPFQGHRNCVQSVSFSPDGRRIVSGSWDQTIRVWNAETGQTVLDPLEGHTDKVCSVVFSPDGGRIVSGSYDRMIRVWDTATTPTGVRQLHGHAEAVISVSFSPNGSQILSGSGDCTIRVWNAETGNMVLSLLQGYGNIAWSVAFSPDGEQILSGSQDGKIRVWDAETGETFASPFQGHVDAVLSVAFSPDGERIVSGSNDQTIRVWNMEKAEEFPSPFQGYQGGAEFVSLSSDGNLLPSDPDDCETRLWDSKSDDYSVSLLYAVAQTDNSLIFF
ncbi:hypothetical protein M408DRAFT_76226 [Serendipita vermifera MAFF 305830]|uniref:Nephrocystin 3-like N-terminal domain-containing protein n=1 Tax=Serendipita vermifera MAFF 305830 TaxID=933852 RepID=A0A0C2X4H6_SERVB|nr:hypothetical protein M408DRAFT_76226 [Serendipita vermifera MAFF 305830]